MLICANIRFSSTCLVCPTKNIFHKMFFRNFAMYVSILFIFPFINTCLKIEKKLIRIKLKMIKMESNGIKSNFRFDKKLELTLSNYSMLKIIAHISIFDRYLLL